MEGEKEREEIARWMEKRERDSKMDGEKGRES